MVSHGRAVVEQHGVEVDRLAHDEAATRFLGLNGRGLSERLLEHGLWTERLGRGAGGLTRDGLVGGERFG